MSNFVSRCSDVTNSLCLSLACYRWSDISSDMKQQSSIEQATSKCRCEWPSSGGLSMMVLNGKEEWCLPLSPPFIVRHEATSLQSDTDDIAEDNRGSGGCLRLCSSTKQQHPTRTDIGHVELCFRPARPSPNAFADGGGEQPTRTGADVARQSGAMGSAGRGAFLVGGTGHSVPLIPLPVPVGTLLEKTSLLVLLYNMVLI